jgi:tetratricopeptide (TPR) repeat protein
MDTMGKRYCWTRRAELALLLGDPALALEIVNRLIASAPGMPAGGVITFLWMLKGEALATLGSLDEAASLLQAALENARAQGERFLLWRVHASLGRLYQAMNHQNKAQKEISAAHELIEELSATIPDKALKDNFLQHAYRRFDPP